MADSCLPTQVDTDAQYVDGNKYLDLRRQMMTSSVRLQRPRSVRSPNRWSRALDPVGRSLL